MFFEKRYSTGSKFYFGFIGYSSSSTRKLYRKISTVYISTQVCGPSIPEFFVGFKPEFIFSHSINLNQEKFEVVIFQCRIYEKKPGSITISYGNSPGINFFNNFLTVSILLSEAMGWYWPWPISLYHCNHRLQK